MINKIFVHPSIIKNMTEHNIPIPENFVVQEKLPTANFILATGNTNALQMSVKSRRYWVKK